jgi:hypothetical protein
MSVEKVLGGDVSAGVGGVRNFFDVEHLVAVVEEAVQAVTRRDRDPRVVVTSHFSTKDLHM